MRKGFTLIEMLVLILIIGIMSIVLTLEQKNRRRRAGFRACRANLDQIGKALHLYRHDYGRHVRYPDANGCYFIGRLYQVKLLLEHMIYICPDTSDENYEMDLGATSLSPDAISYAGRKNAAPDQRKYPGIYKPFHYTTLTTMASDDWEATPNHDEGRVINFLFLDGHGDRVELPYLSADNYTAFCTRGEKLADAPLTN